MSTLTWNIPEVLTEIGKDVRELRADISFSVYGQLLLDSTDAASARSTLGLGAGATADVLTTASWEAGTSTTEALVSPAKLTAVIDANDNSIGVGQTWQDVSASRATSTSYQNTTGRPIQVAITYASNGNIGVFEVSTDGTTWLTVATFASNGRGTHWGIVPNGHYYRVDTATFDEWCELR